jgi:hypothetical protein
MCLTKQRLLGTRCLFIESRNLRAGPLLIYVFDLTSFKQYHVFGEEFTESKQ